MASSSQLTTCSTNIIPHLILPFQWKISMILWATLINNSMIEWILKISGYVTGSLSAPSMQEIIKGIDFTPDLEDNLESGVDAMEEDEDKSCQNWVERNLTQASSREWWRNCSTRLIILPLRLKREDFRYWISPVLNPNPLKMVFPSSTGVVMLTKHSILLMIVLWVFKSRSALSTPFIGVISRAGSFMRLELSQVFRKSGSNTSIRSL